MNIISFQHTKIIIYILPDYIQVWMLLHFLRSVIKELWKNNYYDDMNNSNDADAFRGNEFLQNNSYEDVEDVILNNLGCFTYEDLKNNSNYADALRFLERLKAWQ